ncbi:MAG: hypothetical protein Q9182_003690 [Xanthomendoza sp. 2 TL-2023]
MKPFVISILASVLTFAAAVPLEKRILVVETVTDVVVKTVDVTTTLWVSPGRPTPQVDNNNNNNNNSNNNNNQHGHHHAHNNKHKTKNKPLVQKVAPAPAPAPIPAQPQSSPPEAYHSPAVQQPAAPAPIPAQPPAPPAAPVVQVANKQAVPVPQPAAPINEAPSPPVPAPVPSPQPVAPAPAPAPAPVAPIKSNANLDSNAGSMASCGKVGMPCSGDITFYDTGLGACGWTNDGLSENVFALAHEMMGAQSNGNPFCGRSAEVTLDGKTVVGKLVDKCGGCKGQSIDLGHKMFQALADERKGRISGVTWRFID